MSTDTPNAPPPEQTVPYQRFQSVNQRKAELEARIVELEAEAQRLTERAATADTLAQQLEAANQATQAAQQGLTEYQAAARLGVTDPELYEAARWAHSRMPEEDRPAFADALQAWKDDPGQAPLVLRPHLQPAPAPAPAAAPPQGAPPAPAPNGAPPPPNNGTQPFPSAPATLDPSKMDIDTYRQHRDKFKGTTLL